MEVVKIRKLQTTTTTIIIIIIIIIIITIIIIIYGLNEPNNVWSIKAISYFVLLRSFGNNNNNNYNDNDNDNDNIRLLQRPC